MRGNPWNEIELQFLIETYPDHFTENIAKVLNCSLSRIYNKANQLSLKKSEAFMNSQMSGRLSKMIPLGVQYRFKKGQEPTNKGKKWAEWMRPEAQERSKKTTFKKGNIPATMVHNGEPYLYAHKQKNGYIEKIWFIQEGTNKRSAYMAYLCRINGIDLQGKKPILKPGFDHSRPPTIDDIMILTNAENMARNTIHRYPPELKFAIKKLNQLKRTINGKKQDSGSQEPSFRDDRVA